MATSSGTPGIMWDRQREYVFSGHRCAPKDVKLANLHIIDRKVCNRVQELIHSETKTQTASCKYWSWLISSCVSRATPTPSPPYFSFLLHVI